MTKHCLPYMLCCLWSALQFRSLCCILCDHFHSSGEDMFAASGMMLAGTALGRISEVLSAPVLKITDHPRVPKDNSVEFKNVTICLRQKQKSAQKAQKRPLRNISGKFFTYRSFIKKSRSPWNIREREILPWIYQNQSRIMAEKERLEIPLDSSSSLAPVYWSPFLSEAKKQETVHCLSLIVSEIVRVAHGEIFGFASGKIGCWRIRWN